MGGGGSYRAEPIQAGPGRERRAEVDGPNIDERPKPKLCREVSLSGIHPRNPDTHFFCFGYLRTFRPIFTGSTTFAKLLSFLFWCLPFPCSTPFTPQASPSMDVGTLTASVASSVFSRVICYPLDTIAVQHTTSTRRPLLSVPISTYYRGLPVSVALVTPAFALYLCTYRQSKSSLQPYLGDSTANYVASGAVAEVVSSLLWTPLVSHVKEKALLSSPDIYRNRQSLTARTCRRSSRRGCRSAKQPRMERCSTMCAR